MVSVYRKQNHCKFDWSYDTFGKIGEFYVGNWFLVWTRKIRWSIRTTDEAR